MIDRKAVTGIIEKEDGVNWWKPELFAKNILSELPKEWDIVSPPPAEESNYNCFVFAFGLENDTDFLGGKNPIQKEFVRHLLAKSILEETSDELAPGNLVFYEADDGVITHGGIVQDDGKILSKFMWGPTVRHELWNVPSSFGDRVFYTSRPDFGVVKEEYERYRDSGVEIKPIL